MGDDEGHGPRGEPPVRCQQLVLSQYSFNDRDPADKKHHDQSQVASSQTRQIAEKHGDASRGRKLLPAFGGDGEGDARSEAKPGQDRRDLGDDGTWNRARPR